MTTPSSFLLPILCTFPTERGTGFDQLSAASMLALVLANFDPFALPYLAVAEKSLSSAQILVKDGCVSCVCVHMCVQVTLD